MSSTDRDSTTSARQTSFWSVHEHVEPLLTAVGSWPMLGSPAWCLLPVSDPRKVAALFSAAEHWALRLETCQQALADASREVAATADWRAIAVEWLRLNTAITDGPYYIERTAS